jgi:hypothetical protein
VLARERNGRPASHRDRARLHRGWLPRMKTRNRVDLARGVMRPRRDTFTCAS